ncbi:hypothetical protein KR084_000658 [Drosophila pseudotakahashii]|nr:hypothetical protein KR084_000658 [Drosophila pseudotakahashii]
MFFFRFPRLQFRRGAAWQTLFLLCALAYCINEASSEGRVVCYYTNWSVYRPGTAKFNPQNINPYLCTHLVYAFGGFTKDNQMKPFDKYQDIEQGGYAKFTGLKTYNKQLKTMIAIGGWNEASSRFSPLVASNERRQQFIKNILKFLRQNHFDGIDLDWEYPAHREGGKSRDRDNYAQFVQELRAEFEREAEKTGRTRLLLTMAVPAGIEYIDKGYDVPKLNKYLDWFNVLTYDFHSSHEPSVNHHAPLYSLEEDSEYNYDAELNIDYSIKYYLKAGADRDKLVLGIPTYGRSYTLINEESTELGAPSEGPGEQGDATREKGYLAYYEICQTLKDDPEWTVVQPNANVMGPYAYRRNQWVGYDDEGIVRKKAEYVVAQGLGGIMFWAIDNDDFRGTCNGKPYPLIEAAKEAMVEALGLGINEVAKPSGPQKPSRSRSRDNASTRNRLNGKTEATPSSRRPSATRRPAISSTTTRAPPPPSTTFKLTEAEGSSLYIGGRASTTPPPPTTPDPGSDFKCEEEGFFQHPRDCKKYYWCLDSGPSGLGIVAHMFTCPSGLYFNPAADSCDFARNVPCKTKKSTTAAPAVTSTTPLTTTVRSNRVTAAPTARPVYPRTTTSTTTSTTTTSTTTTPASVDEDLEYEEDTDELSPSKSTDAEEDPQVIKELIDLIRKVGGVEQLEKHLLRNKDGSITLKENSASGAATTPSTISKSLYDRVLSRPGTLSSFTRDRFKISEATETSTEATASSSSSSSGSSSGQYSKYSSVLRGNSRQGPQNEGIEKLAEFDGFLKERKQYVTINRHRSASQGDEEEEEQAADQQEEEENLAEVQTTTTRRPLSSVTPSYTSLRRTRPTTVAPPAEQSQQQEEAEQQTQTQVKSYATLSRTRGRTTATPEVTEAAPSSTTNRYKYFERTRPTKSASATEDVNEDPTEDQEEEEYEDEQKEIVTVQSKQSTNTRKYASIGRRTTTTTTTTATPETTTTTTAGTETAKASTTTTNNYKNHYNSSNNNYNNVKLNNLIPTEENNTATPSTTAQSETTTTTTNETTEPNESTSTTTTTTITNNLHTITTTTPTPIVASTVPTTTTSNGISSDSLLATELSEASPTLPPSNPDIETTTPTTTTTTESELATTTTTTPKTTTTTGNNELNDVNNNNVDEDSEVTKTKTQYKYATTNRRRITTTTTNNNNNNAEAANDASPTNGLSSLNSIRTNPGRRQPQPEQQTQTTTTEPTISSPRPFGYPRRRTRPTTASTSTTTIPQTDNTDNNTDNNDNETEAVAQVVKKTRLSPGDRPKVSASLPTATAISNSRTKTKTTSSLHHQESQVEVANGNGGNDSLRHEVVSSSLSESQNHIDTESDSDVPRPTTEPPTQQHLKYTWRAVRRPASQRTVVPNSLAGDDKDSRRFAGKQLNTEESDGIEDLQQTTKFRSRRLNSAEDESEVALEVATQTQTHGSRSYQSIQRSSASKTTTDESQIRYKAITRDSEGGAHLTAGRSSSFVRNVGEAAKTSRPHQPISRGGQILESTTEDENVAAEIIDDEKRGETKAPAGSVNTDDSNTATEQESPEIVTEAAPPQLEVTETSDVQSSSSSEAPASSTTEQTEASISSTTELSSIDTEPKEAQDTVSESNNIESSTEISSSEAPVSSTTEQSEDFSSSTTESNSEAIEKELASSEAPASSSEVPEISSTTVISEEETTTTTETPTRRSFNRFSSTTPEAESEEESTSTANPRRRVIVRTRTSTTEEPSEVQSTTEVPKRRGFSRSSTEAPSNQSELESEVQSTTEGPTRRSFLRTRTTEATSTTETTTSTTKAPSSPTESESEVETTTEGPTRRSFFRSSTTEAPSSTTEASSSPSTEEINSSSIGDEADADTTTTRRSFFHKNTPSTTEATTTTTAEETDVSSSTRRSLFRTSSTTEATTTTTTTEGAKEGEDESESTTALPRRRVIVRGSFRPRKEGDLSSLLAADGNKRARKIPSTTSTETPDGPSASSKEEETEQQEPQSVEKVSSGRTSLNAVRNRTTTKTESLGNGITRTRTTYVRTLDAGQKVVKRIHTKTVEEKPAEYEYIVDEVTHPPPPSTTPRTVTRNRGSVRFESNDLSSLLALDFASRSNRKKQAQTEATVTKTRRRLLKKPKETIEHEEVEEFEYEAGQDGNEVEETPRVSTTARPIIRRTRPTRGSTTTTTTEQPKEIEASTRGASFAFKRPSKASTTTEEPTTTSTEPAPPSEATTRRVLNVRRPLRTTTTAAPIEDESTEEATFTPVEAITRKVLAFRRPASTTTTAASIEDESTEEATSAPVETTTRKVLSFRRPVSTTTTPVSVEDESTEEATVTEGTTRRVLANRRPVSTTTTTTPALVEDESTEDQLAAAKQHFVNRFKTSTTTTTTTATEASTTAATEEDLSDLKVQLSNAINRLQSENKLEAQTITKGSETSEDDGDDKLSLPIYHRRKYYQYVKDSPITYIDKSPAPPDIESVTVNIKQQIHDVFNVSENETPSNSLGEEGGESVDHRLAMEQAKEINAELGHFLLKTPGSKVKSQRQGKTFKTIPLATDSSNETSKIVSYSLLEERERSEDEARALRTYTRLNRTRLTLSTRLQEKTQNEPLETTTRRSYSVPQRFRVPSTTPNILATENSEEDEEDVKEKTQEDSLVASSTTKVPTNSFKKFPTRRVFIPRRPVNAVEDSDSSNTQNDNEEELKVESTTRRTYAGLNRLRGRGSTTTTTTEEATDSTTEAATTTTVRSTRQPYVGISRRVTTTTAAATTTTTEKPAENEIENSELEDEESTTVSSLKEEDIEENKVEIKETEEEVENEASEEPENSTEEPELEAHIDDDNEIPLQESGPSTDATTTTTTTTTTSSPASTTTARRQLVIRRRFNGTIITTTTTTAAPEADENLENEIDQNDTESSTPKAVTTTPPRRQLLIRRRFNATVAAPKTTTTTLNPSADNEIDQGDSAKAAKATTATTRRTILSRRRFNATSISTTTTGSTNGDEISTRRPYAALNRSRNRFTTPRTTTTDGGENDGDDDDDDDEEKEEQVSVSPPRAVFLQTNRHRALQRTPEEEEEEVPARKPPSFAARRTTAAPPRLNSSTRRNLVALNRNLYHRAEGYDEQDGEEEEPEEEDNENDEDGQDEQEEEEESVDPQITSTTARSRLSQLLANRQRQPLRTTTTQKPTETDSTTDTKTDSDNEDDKEENDDDDDDDSSAEVSNSNHTLNQSNTRGGGNTTNPNNLTNRSTALNVASQRSNSTVANYINRFKSNSYTNNSKNKPVTVTANLKPDSPDNDDNGDDNDNVNDDDNDASLENVEGEEKKSNGAGLNALGNDVNSTRRFQNRYQLSRTRGSTTNTTPTSTTTTQQPPTTTTARRLAFGGRQRGQVTKLTLVDEQTEEHKEEDGEEEEEEEEDSSASTTTTTTTTTSRPTPKRIRVLKFRRPLNSNSNSTTVDSTTNSATDTNNPDTTTPTTLSQSNINNNNTTSTTGNKRFRKIVRKLRPVVDSSSTASSVDNSEETTRKPFVPSHTRFTDSQDNNDLVNLRQRIKEQQARGEPQDGVISNRFKTLGQKDDQDVSDLQRLRDKVKAEQARGDGEQGVINDRLKKLLAEKGTSTNTNTRQREESATEDESSSSVSSVRPFKRKLVARRPYTPPSASGNGGTTKAPLAFSTTRPTAKFVRKKNGRFDPFNSSVRNRGEGFVRSDPRGSRLPGADRFKNQGEDGEEVEERHVQNQFATTLRRPFVPKTRPVSRPQQADDEAAAEGSEEDDDEEEDSEEEGDEEEDEDEDEAEAGKKQPDEEEKKSQEETKANNPYKPKDNRVLPGSRPTFGATGSGSPPTASGNVPFNPRNRPSSSSSTPPSNRFGTTKRPRVVNRPPGVASPNLTLKPVASDYERTTPLTLLKPAPFIPSNNRSYERKYTGPSTEASETASENSLIEDLNIDALNARNKKIFDKHSKKHPALKPKVVKVESETEAEVETGTEAVAVEEETTEEQQDQGFVTTTPSTPPSPPPPAPPSTQSDTATTTDTPPETETEIETVTETETATNANEATSINSQDQSTTSTTTQAPPPATTLLHVFTLLEGEGEGAGPEEEPTTTRRPTQKARLHPTVQTEVVPKHKLIEINRIVEINSKQAKAAQRKSKANQDFGTLRVESLPHVEQLGEISVVKYVHLVDGSDIQINDGHSTVADYTPTEPNYSAVSAPVRNSLPETETDADRSGKSLVPEVLTGALETSTISLEGLFDSARKGKQLSSNSIIGDSEAEESTTISSSSAAATETTGETTTPAPTYLRQPTTGSVSRRPVLSVRRRIINSPTSAAIEATTTQQPAEPPTTSKYNRLRSRPSAAAAAAATTTTAAAAATTVFPAATSVAGGRTSSNIYLNKLKVKSGAAAAAAASGEAATLTPATSNISSSSNINGGNSNIGSNDITQKQQQHKFQPASFALRRQFQTRRLTTFAPAANGDESATDVPRTQNPLFKRRLTLISTTPPSARTTNPPNSGLETTTTLYLNDDDEDQVAKSSIHTSRFNQIPEQVRPREEYELALPAQPLKSTSTTTSTTANAPLPVISQGIRRQLIPRPRRPQSTTATPPTTPTLGSSLGSSTPAGHSAPPLSRRQQSRRRPHKYIEVYSRPPAKSAVLTATSSSQLLAEDGGYQVAQRRRSGSIAPAKTGQDTKVIVHGRGIIECRAQGNFPHPLNCRKFISCARFEETGGIVGWEYTCPKGLTYDGVGGMCTWSPSDQPCRD